MKHIFELQMSRLSNVFASPAMCWCIDEARMEWLCNSNAYKLASFVLIYALILVFGCSFDHLVGLVKHFYIRSYKFRLLIHNIFD